MEIFFAADVYGSSLRLGPEESQHCAKVLRKRVGDSINVIDGAGNMYRCTVVNDSPKGVEASIDETVNNWNSHPYHLTAAVCPTKNNDRYEWFAEKATEFGVDCIVPVIGDRSERKVFKTDRLCKIVLSATKQSLKAKLPKVEEPTSVKSFIKSTKDSKAVKMIAYCASDEIIVLVGPEGDFSKEEALLAIECGYVPVHLGDSRLRTETAGVAAAAAVYFEYMK